MNDNDLNDLFRQIGKKVQDIASPENIAELKNSIDETVREVKNAVKQSSSSKNKNAAPPPYSVPHAPPIATPPPAPKAPPTASAPPKAPKSELAVPSNQIPGHAAGPLLTVLGAGGMIASGAALLHLFLSAPFYSTGLAFYFVLLALSSTITALGTVLRTRVRRYRSYLRELSGAAFCSIRSLAGAVNKSTKYVVRDIKKMIHRGYFPQGHLDEQNTCLMLDDATYNRYKALMEHAKEKERAEQQRQEQMRSNPELESAIREGKQYLTQIREANEAIPGEEISRKLSRLESITEKIFDFVSQHPNKLP